MPKDAKFGMALGVVLVILIAVIFFRRDPAVAKSAEATSAAVKPGTVPAPGVRRSAEPGGKKLVVKAGARPFSLAGRDDNAKREVRKTPKRPAEGTVPVVPEFVGARP